MLVVQLVLCANRIPRLLLHRDEVRSDLRISGWSAGIYQLEMLEYLEYLAYTRLSAARIAEGDDLRDEVPRLGHERWIVYVNDLAKTRRQCSSAIR